ncbi:type II toxin-antitoxin system RelE family toxin [Sphingobium algorifonticola]|uniref:Addiction module toxin RelE n=1 Tax=Sphingobium algorifonticola TaxID=2008318 RepID=A0A437J8J9_9SPHN|nr:type II toxin-antitoxin system RelE/ParE family toxin [Sphingobium algorifonticola]RVT41824.1 addiction module toxin RelE [Sphingobium algorifonticola]
MDVRFSKTAGRALLRSNKRLLIRQKIDELANDPLSLSANVKKLQGRPEYRLRIQDWRILFRIEGDILWIDDIAPRGSAYEVNP